MCWGYTVQPIWVDMKDKKKDKNILLKAIKDVIEGEESVLFAYLYGSLAHSASHSESDIDVAVYLTLSDMKGYLEKEKRIFSALVDHIHTDRIDLRILNVLPLVLQYNVLKEGIPILIKDEQSKIDFETEVMNRYFELKPYLDESKEMLFKRIREGLLE